MLRKLLFETKAGDALLSLFERLTGLAIVPVEDLAKMRAEPIRLGPERMRRERRYRWRVRRDFFRSGLAEGRPGPTAGFRDRRPIAEVNP